MDLTLALRAFVRTVERGSVTAAARDLGVSQPAVSKLLRNLEQEVQARLLERNSRSLRPTPQGLRLYQDVAGALSTVEAAIETARSETSRMEGTLRLHSPVCLGERHVQEIAFAFQDRHPGISIELVLENRMPDLIHENMDLAFAIEQPRTEATICRRVGTVRRLLVASRDYAARHGTPDEPGDLARHPIIATDIALGHKGSLALHASGAPVEVSVRPSLVTNNAKILLNAIMAGRGIGTAQAHMVARELADGQLVHILPRFELKSSALFLAYPSARYLRPPVRAFIDFAIEAIRAVPSLCDERATPPVTRSRRLASNPS